MLLIMRGYTSSYALWSYIRENKTEYLKRVAYKNVNQRFLRLARLGLLEEIQLGENPHRRIDYRLTMKGLEELVPYILSHPQEVKNVVQYMDKSGLSKETFGHRLIDNVEFAFNTANEYLTYSNLPEVGAMYYGRMKIKMNVLHQIMDKFRKDMDLVSEATESFKQTVDEIKHEVSKGGKSAPSRKKKPA